MDFDKIVDALAKIDVAVNQNGFIRKGTKQKADTEADTVLKLNGVTRTEFLDEFNKRLKEQLKKLDADLDSEGSLYNEYKYTVINHKLLDEVSAVGNADLVIFKKIKYATNPIDGSIILLVNTKDATWKPIPLSGSANLDRIQLVTVCSKAEPVHPDVADNYYDEIVLYTTKPIRDIFSKYKDKRIKSKDALVMELIEKVPHTLLQNACIKALCKEKKITRNDKSELLWIPQTAALYTSVDSMEKYDPFLHLVKKAYALAALPEFQCEMPAVISNNPNTPAFHYIDLKTIHKEGPTPTWDEFSERFSPDDFRALQAFIWSIFKAKNKGRQLLYIYDPDGFSGKSVLMSVLARFLGPDISASIQKDSLNNQFSLAKIWDKRLVTIDDNKNRNLIRSEKMHMILGGGWADIEMKGRNSFHAKLFTKMIAGGNVPLAIDPYAVHERTRLIMIKTVMNDEILKRFCQLDENGELVLKNGKPVMLGDPSFEENLYDEFPYFLSKCRAAYKELCPTDANIILTEEQVDNLFNLADDNDYVFDKIVEDGFDVGENYSMPPYEFQTVFYRQRRHLEITMGKEIADRLNLADFKEYLAKRYPYYGVTRPRSDGGRSRVIHGLRKKEELNLPVSQRLAKKGMI